MPEPSPSGITLKPPLANGYPGGVEGDNTSPEGQHEPDYPDPASGRTPVGDGGEGIQGTEADEGGDVPLKVEAILERFAEATKNRYRQDGETLTKYGEAFRRFARTVNLEAYARKQLTPTRSRKLLLDFIQTLPKGSKRWFISALKSVWLRGLRLPFPIDPPEHFGRSLPATGTTKPRICPRDDEVLPFALALEQEPSAYVRAFVRALLTYGPRPGDQLGALRWDNIQWDQAGRPRAIVAMGAREGFKTGSPWIASLPQVLGEDLLAWKAEAPGSNPEAPLFPYRNKAGNVTRGRHHDDETARTLWQDFRQRHAIISDLTMAHLRHWVKRKGRRRFTDNLAMVNYWQGHKPEGGGMAGHYGTNLPVEDILEEQLREWPGGPLGDLLPPKVIHDPGLPEALVKAWYALLAGEIDADELKDVARDLARKARPTANLLKP